MAIPMQVLDHSLKHEYIRNDWIALLRLMPPFDFVSGHQPEQVR